MLKINNLFKSFKIGTKKISILKDINLNFKPKELVFILGKSGSGKSTLLNIIGGLLKADNGEIYLDEECITRYKDKKLDNYRSNIVSFIFQDYHLIEYMSVYDNIKLSLNKIDKNKVEALLKQLGIYEKRNIKVNKLSGGEKQRVAIARAIIKDPEIILCDEPTGALDTETGIKVMDILKQISKNKLVIVVSHDRQLASTYADRIIEIKDGMIKEELNDDKKVFKINNQNKINKLSIIKLAIKNLLLNKKRTLLISLAISLGITSLLLVANLSLGMNREIKELENKIISIFPITVSNSSYELENKKLEKSNNKIIIKDNKNYIHTNKIDNKYIDYLNNIKEIKHITYKYDISMPLVTDNYKLLLNNYMIPIKKEQINNNYYVLAGRNIENKNEILLKVDSNNNVTNELLNTFNIDKDIEYSEILGRKIKLILNDNYYKKDNNYYHINDNLKEIYQESKLELTIVGVVKEKEITDESNYIIYSQEIIKDVLEANEKSIIVKEQLKKDYNILGNNLSIEDNLSFLGYKTIPSTINIYVDNIKDKEKVINKLDEYNKNNKELIYEDAMNDAISIVKDFMNIITAILVIFSFISLLVSMILISVITNTRVLERIKEIGILRSLGASKKNIRKLFNIENSIISILSFVISISTILLIKKTLNTLLYSIIESNTIFKLEYSSLILVFIFNLLLVLLSGLIPSIKASNIEITECIKR